jgi:hypothetical protein
MRCTNCGIELHERALHCWKCGQDTPNYAAELAARNREAEEQRLQDAEQQRLQEEQARVTLESAPVTPVRGKKQVLVYRKHWFGQQLVGWLDEFGHTYRRETLLKFAQVPDWSVDEEGKIYLVFGEVQALIGWVEFHDVYSKYGNPAAGFSTSPDSMQIYMHMLRHSPELVFQISDDGTVYRLFQHGASSIGKVVGAPDFGTVAALALVILL